MTRVFAILQKVRGQCIQFGFYTVSMKPFEKTYEGICSEGFPYSKLRVVPYVWTVKRCFVRLVVQ